ncbi:hypothetical protein BLNAU_3210 [Blattamonas nauphoetae]|uniref:Uncharacterized protein n=1 Tax=Blattamonas nauphoetae TaxID=2049346 RepID=A0ABQ9YDD5_9EUKA|nr:hypothetical protein BLNAU_3210 [Blattamonas nauphoetae]
MLPTPTRVDAEERQDFATQSADRVWHTHNHQEAQNKITRLLLSRVRNCGEQTRLRSSCSQSNPSHESEQNGKRQVQMCSAQNETRRRVLFQQLIPLPCEEMGGEEAECSSCRVRSSESAIDGSDEPDTASSPTALPAAAVDVGVVVVASSRSSWKRSDYHDQRGPVFVMWALLGLRTHNLRVPFGDDQKRCLRWMKRDERRVRLTCGVGQREIGRDRSERQLLFFADTTLIKQRAGGVSDGCTAIAQAQSVVMEGHAAEKVDATTSAQPDPSSHPKSSNPNFLIVTRHEHKSP